MILMAHESSNAVRLEKPARTLPAVRFKKISHDFCSSLSIIIGNTELLLDEAPGMINDKQRVCLEDILHSSRRLLDSLDDMVDGSNRYRE